jgi:hypothetical protein
MYGYEFEVIEGYHWNDKDFIFRDFASTIYNMRLTYDKTDARNFICKLLLNSLYGRFGMSPHYTEYQIVDPSTITDLDYNNLLTKADDIIFFGDIQLVGTPITKNNFKANGLTSKNKAGTININTPIAMFITAYARLDMSNIKVQYKDHLYYSDTDSLILNKELSPDLVNNKLGNFKLVNKVKKGIFLAPKVYALVLDNDQELIINKGVKIVKDKENNIVPAKGLIFDTVKDCERLMVKPFRYNEDERNNLSILNFSLLEKLLYKDKVFILEQEKFQKYLNQGTIFINTNPFTLSITQNKREWIFNHNNKLIGTKPIIINK